jgi:hypothetical protein
MFLLKTITHLTKTQSHESSKTITHGHKAVYIYSHPTINSVLCIIDPSFNFAIYTQFFFYYYFFTRKK